MGKRIMFGGTIDEDMVIKARETMRKLMPIPVSDAAMLRILIGLLGDNKVDVIVEDMAKYSAETFSKGGFARKKATK